MTGGPPVGLVTPVHNGAAFLPATLASVGAQTHRPLDYLVVDDGSTDATPVILAAAGVRVLTQPNAGQAAALNAGWAAVEGRYLGYLSADDLLAPAALATMAAILDEDPGAVAAVPQADLIDAHGRVLKRAVCRPFDLAQLVVGQECWIGPGALFRADAFARVGGWRTDLRLAPDREFWMRLAAHGRIVVHSRTLAQYRLHPGATSYREVSEAVSREYLTVLDAYFARADVPAAIRARSREAYGRAHLLIARNRLRAGDWAGAWRYRREAARLHPPLGGPAPTARLLRAAVGKSLRMAQASLRA